MIYTKRRVSPGNISDTKKSSKDKELKSADNIKDIIMLTMYKIIPVLLLNANTNIEIIISDDVIISAISCGEEIDELPV